MFITLLLDHIYNMALRGRNSEKNSFIEKNRCPLLFAKHKYNCYRIIKKCLGFYNLKSNERYTFFMNSIRKLYFFLSESRAIFTFIKSIYTCNVFINFLATIIFYKQLAPGLCPQSCLHLHGFRGAQSCLMVA